MDEGHPVQPARAILITPEYTVVDDHPGRTTPSDAFDAGLPALLARVAARFDREGVVLVDQAAAGLLGLPTVGPLPEDGMDAHQAAADARAAGWEVERISDWSRFKRKGHASINLGIIPLIKRAECPLLGESDWASVPAFTMWHQLTGRAWRGNGAMAGHAVLMDRMRTSGKAKITLKLKKPQEPDPQKAQETPYTPGQWAGERPKRYALGFDLNRAYIGAANVVEVAPWPLKRTGKREFSPLDPGWWQVELQGTWNDPRMPDPAGYRRDNPRVRWITTPRAALLAQLAEQGLHGGFLVLDSYTMRTDRFERRPQLRLFKPWAEVMGNTFAEAARLAAGDDVIAEDAAAVLEAVKLVGHKTPGAWASPTNFIYRRDWWHSVIAMNGANLWRRMWKIGSTKKVWPWYVDTDCVWYGSDHDDHARFAEEIGLPYDPTGIKLGHFKPNKKGPVLLDGAN
jgi:hypothetical protein